MTHQTQVLESTGNCFEPPTKRNEKELTGSLRKRLRIGSFYLYPLDLLCSMSELHTFCKHLLCRAKVNYLSLFRFHLAKLNEV